MNEPRSIASLKKGIKIEDKSARGSSTLGGAGGSTDLGMVMVSADEESREGELR